MVYIVLIFLLLGIFAHINTGLNDVNWHKTRSMVLLRPSGRFDALTWVDKQGQLWLYGGKTVIRANGSEFTNHLSDLWKFNPGSYHWNKITHQNSSLCPQFDKALACFCNGLAFMFGNQVHKKKQIPELWVYNASSNSWNSTPMSSNVTSNDSCLTLICNKDSKSISLLCYNNSMLKLWIYAIKSSSWSLKRTVALSTSKNISDEMPRRYSIWNSPNGLSFIYAWSYLNIGNNSVLFSVGHGNITSMKVNVMKLEYFSNRKGFIRWIDNAENLHLLGGKIENFTDSSGIQWMLNRTNYKWRMVNSKNLKPSPRNDACVWHGSDTLWLFGGYFKDSRGYRVVLNDFWIGSISNTSKPVVHQPTPLGELPGDTLGLSMVNKLIIAMVTLIIVMAISIRLCYKRELNHLLSRLKKDRVLYHQLSQEGDKSTRL